MSYDDAVAFISSSVQYGSRLGLERIARLCSLLGNPQDSIRTVHVAGTNGKGSTCAMIAQALTAAGYKTGLYMSPAIEDVCECIRINGSCITHEEFGMVAALVSEKAQQMADEPPTEFEIETAMAFQWFVMSGCDVAVIETGLGGRLDATNVINSPMVSVITSVSYDHVNLLGDTLDKIAREKCGIIKPGGITVSYPLQDKVAMDTILDWAGQKDSRLIIPDAAQVQVLHAGLNGTDVSYGGLSLHIPLIGSPQVWNAITAVETLRAMREYCGLSITGDNIADGIGKVTLPLRQEILCHHPVVLMDGAHNLDKLAALAETMKAHLSGKRVAVIMGMLQDKDYVPSIKLIASLCDKFITSQPTSSRALPSSRAAELAIGRCNDVRIIDDYKLALEEALRFAGNDGAVVVCGSFYLAGPVRRIYNDSLTK